MAVKNKVLLYGLDGVSWELLDPWLKDGTMPNLSGFLQQGCQAVLETTIPTLTMPALPSLYTGKNPGELGIFSLSKPSGEIFTISDIDYPRIWDYCGERGLRSLVFNAKFTYPPDEMQGIMVSAGPLPSADAPYTYPREMRAEIEKLEIPRTVDRADVLSFEDIDQAPERHSVYCVEEMRSRFKRFVHLWEKESFPFVFYWEGMTDAVQHRVWYYPSLLKDFFRELDLILGEVFERFRDYNIILVSDHGFHGTAQARFHVNSWLEELGYLKRSGGALSRPFMNLVHYLARNYIPDGLLEKAMKKLRGKKKSSRAGEEKAAEGKGGQEGPDPYDGEEEQKKRDLNYAKSWNLGHLPGIDYKNSRAFQSEQWGIDVLNCRDPEEYERIREDIITRAGTIRAPEKALSLITRKGVVNQEDPARVFQLVKKREEVFSGRHMEEVPDIVFLTSFEYFPEYQLSSKLYSRPVGKSRRVVPGDHNRAPLGIFAAAGPGIATAGRMAAPVRIYDILPTILHLMELPLPDDLDGELLEFLMLEKRKPESYSRAASPVHEKKELSQEEQQEMRERLKGMGYLDEL